MLVRGEKGTAKSTAVRALAALLPEVAVVVRLPVLLRPGGARTRPARTGRTRRAAAPRRARPGMVELPVGASEDRLVGALDIERALAEGVKAFEPGLLADAHRGILYVDEVNLLHDHLVDLLLDAAAMGASYVEREGVSVRHAARFLLVGTMNPEEGELRPQLLDRFGLTVEVAASREPDRAGRGGAAAARLRRRSRPGSPRAGPTRRPPCAARIVAARELLPSVRLGDGALRQIAATCAAFEVDGMRADIVMARTATRAGRLGGADRRARRGRAAGRAAGAAAPAPAQPVRRPGPGRGQARRDAARSSAGDDDPDPAIRTGPDGGGGRTARRAGRARRAVARAAVARDRPEADGVRRRLTAGEAAEAAGAAAPRAPAPVSSRPCGPPSRSAPRC